MLKALFFDLDQTLCDTTSATEQARQLLEQGLQEEFGTECAGQAIASAYVAGVYRQWSDRQRERYLPLIEARGEGAYRLQLLSDLLTEHGVNGVSEVTVSALQHKFDSDRIAAFKFYPGIREFLAETRKLFTLVVITNGPEYSQIPKVQAVDLAAHVDYIIIGGQEPEQKPARSIFDKALKLANCEAHEAIHVGDSLATDIAGAHNSGITSVWIQHQQPLDAELGINPGHTLLHPSEIPALIRDLHYN
jgi:N-acylneuraminate-9-phosphatase